MGGEDDGTGGAGRGAHSVVGTVGAAGTLLFQGFHCNRLLLLGTAEIRNYLRVVFHNDKSITCVTQTMHDFGDAVYIPRM